MTEAVMQHYDDDSKKLIKQIILCFCAVVLYPFCLVKDFHAIKKLGVFLFCLEQFILVYMVLACWYGGELIVEP